MRIVSAYNTFMRWSVNKGVLYTAISAAIIIGGALVAIQYAKGGYRVTDTGWQRDTGLLSANSFPTGAQVKLNGRLVAATDQTLYLDPGDYEVEISKDGYQPWYKTMIIEKELVTQTNALLFPAAPSLTTLTFTGVEHILPSPDGQKLLYYTASVSAERKRGLYILDLASSQFSLQKGPRQIVEETSQINLEKATAIWSPDSTELLLITPNKELLLQVDRLNDTNQLKDVSFQRKQILSEWEEEMYLRERQFMREFPEEIVAMATTSAQDVHFSPDKKRLLYTATAELTIPQIITPPLPASSTQPEVRTITPGGIYVYDREEDKNFQVGSVVLSQGNGVKHLLANDVFSPNPVTLAASPSAFLTLQATTSAETATNFARYHTPLFANTFQWYPDSAHLLYREDSELKVVSYDATNPTTVYSGPFYENFLYPWPDGKRLIILTSFSPSAPANLYAVELE
ncbi:MAG: hypothetical protein COY80_01840 [Candidatus Pacebacteria bacterium CG_4_10_14_0_8_um_filter_42_14]|nr:MAG: hypothetical protein COY80_01840 [Candidatus Pacebacteria bacterium CG_4_10_14_0_8_um_filter_42_14]